MAQSAGKIPSGKKQKKEFHQVATALIILIPGVMATRLEDEYGKPVWDPDNPKSMMDYVIDQSGMRTKSRLQLKGNQLKVIQNIFNKNNDGQNRGENGWGGPAWKYYGQFLISLQNHRFNDFNHVVYAFGYDWRKSNLDSGYDLKRFIQGKLQENINSKVIIVSHSMGGMVARACSHNGGQDLIHAMVHVDQPTTGAPVFYRRFKTGCRYLFEDNPYYLFLGHTPSSFALVAGSVRGPMELLPNSQYVNPEKKSGGDWLTWTSNVSKKRFNKDEIYELYKSDDDLSVIPSEWKTDTVYINYSRYRETLRLYIENAKEFHSNLKLYHHPHTHILSCDNVKSDIKIHIDRDKANNLIINHPHSALGDGTVPISSQNALLEEWGGSLNKTCPICKNSNLPGFAIWENIPGVEHASALNNVKVIDQITRWINNIMYYECNK